VLFSPPLLAATLVRRYKRFLADVTLDDGRCITVHCPNTGAMQGCAAPGSRVWLSHSDNARRKYAHTWELVRTAGGAVVGIHSARANLLVREALEAGRIPELSGYAQLRAEVKFGQEASRADFVLEPGRGPRRRRCVVEVKSVTAVRQTGIAEFPDAVSRRASRHLRELAVAVAGGNRAVLLYCIQRDDVRAVRAAAEVDPGYAEALARAMAQGVEVIAYAARVQPRAITLQRRLQVLAP
jgi:sugar fermentation stimulation protein A